MLYETDGILEASDSNLFYVPPSTKPDRSSVDSSQIGRAREGRRLLVRSLARKVSHKDRRSR